MSKLSFYTTLTSEDWNGRLNGWNVSALRLPGASVSSIRLEGGKDLSSSTYQVDDEHSLIRWTDTASTKPDSITVLICLEGTLGKKRDFWIAVLTLGAAVVGLATGVVSLRASLGATAAELNEARAQIATGAPTTSAPPPPSAAPSASSAASAAPSASVAPPVSKQAEAAFRKARHESCGRDCAAIVTESDKLLRDAYLNECRLNCIAEGKARVDTPRSTPMAPAACDRKCGELYPHAGDEMFWARCKATCRGTGRPE